MFEFSFGISRVGESSTSYIVRGCASNTSKDTHRTIFSKACQDGFASDISSSNVDLEMEHMGDSMFFNIGKVTPAEVSDDGELEIEAELDKEHPFSGWLMSQLDKGVPIGLSVRGNPAESHMEEVDGLRGMRLYGVIDS